MARKTAWVARAVLAVLFIAGVEAADGDVQFWRTKFTMTCPEPGNWYHKSQDTNVGTDNKSLEMEYENDKKGLYYCKYGSEYGTKYSFYVQGKVCENCFELDGSLFALAIVMDVLLTAVVMVITYRCTKKRSSAGVTQTSKAPSASRGHGPPVPSPDYESLDPRTRSHGTYSEVSRMG